MQLTVNGVKVAYDAGIRLRRVVEQSGANPERVAVVLNGDVIPRDRWDNVCPAEGDEVEILVFAGGG